MNKNKPIKNNLVKSNLKWGYIFITPGIIGFLCFSLGPMLYSLYISTMDWNIITPMKFIGLKNYAEAFGDKLTWKSLKVTAYYTVLTVPLVVAVSFLVAMLLNMKVKLISLARTIFYIPSIVPVVASAAIWMYIYNPTYGLLNGILRNTGLPTQNFIYGPNSVIPCLAVMAVWGAGNTVIIYLAGLQGVSPQLYEAAKIDGAKGRQTFRHITIPLMTPIIFYNVVMTTIGCLQTFTQSYIMTDGGPADSSLFFSLLIYRNAFKFGRMGYAAALSWILFVIVGALTLVIFSTSNKWVYYETGGDK
ncbi:carbohydrate ABC transporter permease [Anaerocolumna sedimenticola]|nr:sugar ABC transporter permease [Anaerocolumna sedimenticola]